MDSIDRPIAAKHLIGLPFIPPESDSSGRKQIDEWTFRGTGQLVNVSIEMGGWQNILGYANAGLGVGLVTQSSLDAFSNRYASKLSSRP